jgi:hypothetical protein
VAHCDVIWNWLPFMHWNLRLMWYLITYMFFSILLESFECEITHTFKKHHIKCRVTTICFSAYSSINGPVCLNSAYWNAYITRFDVRHIERFVQWRTPRWKGVLISFLPLLQLSNLFQFSVTVKDTISKHYYRKNIVKESVNTV